MSIEVSSNVERLLFNINKFISSEQFAPTFEDEFCFGKQPDTNLPLPLPSYINNEYEPIQSSLHNIGDYSSANGLSYNTNSDEVFNSFLIKTYIISYPNATKVISNGKNLILADSNNLPIKDESGNIVQFNYNKNPDKLNSDLISFYLAHNNNQLDIKTLFTLQIIQEKTDNLTKNDINYENFMVEIEKAKFGVMEDDEKNKYITSALQNSLSQRNTDFFLMFLGVLNSEKIEKINNLLNKKTDNNFFTKNLPIIYCLHSEKLQTQLKEFFTQDEDSTKKNSIENILKTVDSTLDTLITNPQPLNNLNRSELREKTEQIPIIGNDFCASLKSYFYPKKNQNNFININDYTQLDSKKLRKNISSIKDITTLNQIRDFIDKQSFTKAEKEMLNNECYKQQGYIQNTFGNIEQTNMTKLTNEQDQKLLDTERKTHSHTEFHLFKSCKSPIQRELALFVLNNKQIYMIKDLNFKEIINNCNSKDDLSVKIRFLEKIIDTPEFYDKDGNLNKDAVHSINENHPKLSALKLEILSKYIKSEKKVSPDKFLKSLKKIHDTKQAQIMLSKISSENKLTTQSKSLTNKEVNKTTKKNIGSECINNNEVLNNRALPPDVNIRRIQPTDDEINTSEHNNFLYNINSSEHKDYNLKLYTECGLKQKDAELLIDTISSKNIDNSSAYKASFRLINEGFPVKSILHLLSAATASGTFNHEIIEDAIVINKTGINTYIGENISVIKNSDNAQIKNLMSTKKLRDVKDKLYKLPKNTKSLLKNNNINIDEILIKIEQAKSDSDLGKNNTDIETKQNKHS